MKLDADVRNAELDAIATTIGASPKLLLFSAPEPANTSAADSGALLATIDLPATWMNAATDGNKTKTGTWAGTVAVAGSVDHYRLKNTAGTVVRAQGPVTGLGGGGEMELDQVSVALEVGQPVSVAVFTLTAGNA